MYVYLVENFSFGALVLIKAENMFWALIFKIAEHTLDFKLRELKLIIYLL